MRDHTVQIGDKNGRSFKMQLSTAGNLTIFRRLAGGNYDWHWVHETGSPFTGGNYNISYQDFQAGNWRVIDQGFLRYNSGKLFALNSGRDLHTQNIYLLNPDDTWGMKFFEYYDAGGVNDQGIGFVVQPWVLGFEVGRFSWSVAD